MAEAELEKLRNEYQDLTQSYEEKCQDIREAAAAGLKLLGEKDDLQKRLDEMQADLDSTRAEVEKVNQVSCDPFQ